MKANAYVCKGLEIEENLIFFKFMIDNIILKSPKSLYNSLNKSLQIIRPITINNKNSRPGGGWGLKIRTHADKGGRG